MYRTFDAVLGLCCRAYSATVVQQCEQQCAGKLQLEADGEVLASVDD